MALGGEQVWLSDCPTYWFYRCFMIFGRLRFLGSVLVIGMTGCQWSSDGSDRPKAEQNGWPSGHECVNNDRATLDLDTSIISSDAFAALGDSDY